MIEPKPTNQHLLLQIVRDIEILKTQGLQILEASRDHETRIRELERQGNRNAWIPASISVVFTAVATWLITKGYK